MPASEDRQPARDERAIEIAEMIIEISGSSSELVYEPLPEDDPKRRCPVITRAKEVLGWEPRTPTRDGLKRILSWFAERVLKIS